MIKNKITLITISVLFFIAFFGTVFFVYNKPHKDFSNAQADITIDATKLYEHYQDDLSNANLKFLDKVLMVFLMFFPGAENSLSHWEPRLKLDPGDNLFTL